MYNCIKFLSKKSKIENIFIYEYINLGHIIV